MHRSLTNVLDSSAIEDSAVLRIYGVRVEVTCIDHELIQSLRFDFDGIQAGISADDEVLSIRVELGPIPWEIIPPVEESARSSEYVAYEASGSRYVDYSRRVLLHFDYLKNIAAIYGESREFVYERLYLFILARVGEKLDKAHLHRVHGLGFSILDKGILFLIPQGGGKSTLALRLLDTESIRVYSEDSPILTRCSEILPFPFRFAVMKDELPKDVPQEFVRMSGEKVLISTRFWRNKLGQTAVPVSIVLCGKWTAAPEPSIVRLGRGKLLAALCRDCVVGYGLAQLIEIFIRSQWRDIFAKLRIAASRAVTACFLAIRARPYKILLCRDHERNARLLISFLSSELQE